MSKEISDIKTLHDEIVKIRSERCAVEESSNRDSHFILLNTDYEANYSVGIVSINRISDDY